jgi:hypothetical protein
MRVVDAHLFSDGTCDILQGSFLGPKSIHPESVASIRARRKTACAYR